MKERVIHLDDSIYRIVNDYPEIIDILFNIGFSDLKKAGMVNSVGRFMNLKKGSRLKKIDLALIIKTLENNGYRIEGKDDQEWVGK